MYQHVASHAPATIATAGIDLNVSAVSTNHTRSSAVAETTQCFMPLNISLSHSKSLEMTPLIGGV